MLERTGRLARTGPRALLVVAAAAASGGCALAPPMSWEGAHGLVRAGSEETARAVSADVDALLPRILEALPGARSDGVEVWVQDELRRGLWPEQDAVGGLALRAERRVHLRDADPALRRSVLAHELTHLVLQSEWSVLPGPVEEGLCDWVAIALVPEAAPRIRAARCLGALAALGEVSFVVEETCDAPGEAFVVRGARPDPLDVVDDPLGARRLARPGAVLDDAASRGLGFLVAARLLDDGGPAKLRDLCLRARAEQRDVLPTEWLLTAARLGAEGSARAAAADSPVARRVLLESDLDGDARRLIGAEELREIVLLDLEALVPAIVVGARRRATEQDPDRYLDAACPRIGLLPGRGVILLADVAGMREALRRHWLRR